MGLEMLSQRKQLPAAHGNKVDESGESGPKQ